MAKAYHPLKLTLRNKMRDDLKRLTPELRKQQSDAIMEKVIATEVFQKAAKVSVFLSTPTEVDTIPMLDEMFNQNKQGFIPIYSKEHKDMVRLHDMCDYKSLPVTKHGIKQPRIDDDRESALESGGIDLFLMPGLAFTPSGSRLGYGMGFYDIFLHRYFDKHPRQGTKDNTIGKPNPTGREVVLMALSFNEQIISEDELPIEEHDIRLDYIVTADSIYDSK